MTTSLDPLIDCLREENRVPREQLGQRRLPFSDDQGRRLAARAKGLGNKSKLLREVATIVTGVLPSVKLPARTPNWNAHAQRFVRTIKESCLERVILFGESAVRKAIAEFVAHYHSESTHQGCTMH